MAKGRGEEEGEGGGGLCITGRATTYLPPGTAFNAVPTLSQGSVLLLSSGQLRTKTQRLDVLRQDKGQLLQHRGGKAKQRRKKRIKKVEVVGQGRGERRWAR